MATRGGTDLEERIAKQARYWATSKVFDEATRTEIADLLQKQDEQELAERFYRDLEFGTGGMRGVLGAGTARMNIYNVRKASQALATYILSQFDASQTDLGVAISYDSRRFSPEFAQATAGVMAANGIKAFITRELRPTPMLSYMVRHFKCQGGVCVTASHNPPEYNGYKVYWQTGGQIVPPHDKAIIDLYSKIESYEEIRFKPYEQALAEGMVVEVGAEFDEIYFEKVATLCVNKPEVDLKIVYTPLHGTGAMPVVTCLKRFGFNDVLVVPEQEKPDSEFPTVAYPNPEDPKALKLAIDLAQKNQAELVMATDPDSDRIGIVVREGEDYTILNGNQIGSLLVDYVLKSQKEAGRLPASPLVVKTIVTTDLQAKIAATYGASCEETLTGFKWICQLIEDYESGVRKPYREYVCGGEESYGFLLGHFVRDKDAVSACCLAAEMVAYYKKRGKTLSQALDEIFLQHGVYQESLYTATLPGREGAKKIAQMMKQMRADPPSELAGIKVTRVQDLQSSKILTSKDGRFVESASIDLPASNVLQFILEDGSKVSARPSGTEPKIKFYFSVHCPLAKDADQSALKAAKDDCKTRLNQLQDTFVALSQNS